MKSILILHTEYIKLLKLQWNSHSGLQ